MESPAPESPDATIARLQAENEKLQSRIGFLESRNTVLEHRVEVNKEKYAGADEARAAKMYRVGELEYDVLKLQAALDNLRVQVMDYEVYINKVADVDYPSIDKFKRLQTGARNILKSKEAD